MVKSIITTLGAIIVLLCFSLYEQHYINETFSEFKEIMVCVYHKVENDEARKDDALSAQTYWISKKEKLHIFIPHNEIKEIDLWLAESTTLIENNKKEDALSKLDVVIELIEQIPKTFSFRIENIL
jgi:hypothetical protein